MGKLLNYLKRVPPWLWIVLLGLLVFITYDINIDSDLSNYMDYGLNLYNGRGYTEVDRTPVLFRGPLFAFLIMLGFILFGPSPWSAFWVIRVFCILNPLMLYFLGKRLWNVRTGVTAALLALTSYSLNHWSYRHIDAIWPFFVLLGVYLFYNGLESGKTGYFAGAGLALAAGFLVKEVVLLFLPMPLLAVLLTRHYRVRENAWKLGAVYGVFSICVLPWMIYQTMQGGLSFIMGASAPVALKIMATGNTGAVPSLITLVQKYTTGFFHFLHGQGNSLTWNFLLAPLMAAAWIIPLVKSVKGERWAKLLVIAAGAFLPVMLLMGMRQSRLGQGLFFYYLSYLVTAYALWVASERVYQFTGRFLKKDVPIWLTQQRVFVLVAVLAIGTQTLLGTGRVPQGAAFLKRSLLVQLIKTGDLELRITGGLDRIYNDAGNWMKKNLASGSVCMITKPSVGELLYFFSNGDFPMESMPISASHKLTRTIDVRHDDHLVFLSSWRAQLDPRNKVFFMTERGLFTAVIEKDAGYIIVGKRRNYLSLYLDASPSFENVAQFGDGMLKIYKVIKPLQSVEFPVLVSTNLRNYLHRLRTHRQVDFLKMTKKLFGDILKKDAAFVNAVAKGEKTHRVYYVNNSRIYGTKTVNVDKNE